MTDELTLYISCISSTHHLAISCQVISADRWYDQERFLQCTVHHLTISCPGVWKVVWPGTLSTVHCMPSDHQLSWVWKVIWPDIFSYTAVHAIWVLVMRHVIWVGTLSTIQSCTCHLTIYLLSSMSLGDHDIWLAPLSLYIYYTIEILTVCSCVSSAIGNTCTAAAL